MLALPNIMFYLTYENYKLNPLNYNNPNDEEEGGSKLKNEPKNWNNFQILIP